MTLRRLQLCAIPTVVGIAFLCDAAAVLAAPPPPKMDQREIIRLLEQRWEKASQSLELRNSISLEEAIKTGLLNNPVLSKAYAELQSTQWQAIAVRREWFPFLTSDNPNNAPWAITTETTSGNQSDSRTPLSTSQTSRLYTSPRVRLQWSFLDPTRTPRLKSSLALSQSQQLLFDVSARDLVLSIQTAYFALQEARELREDYTRIYELTRQQIERARTLRGAGVGTKGDLDQLRSQLLQQLTQLIQIFQQEMIAANQLAYTLSLEPGALVSPSERLRPLPAWSSPLQATIDEALALREEIRSSLTRADSSGWLSRARLNRYLPLATIIGQTQVTTNALGTGTTLSNGAYSWNQQNSNYLSNAVGLTFFWLMFDGGIAAADSSNQAYAAESNLAQADVWRYTITLQVQNSHATYVASRMVIDTSLEQLRSARQTVDFTSRNYNGTNIDATTYIQNIQNYLNAARNYKSSVRDYNDAISSLYRYSAQWPMASRANLNERLPALQRQ
jgi:outer membrane protein TolC